MLHKIISVVLLLIPLHFSLGYCWTAPIGIPSPPFPADLDVARPSVPSPWSENTAGFWYIKNGGTNVGNGYPADPRDSIDPASLSAGDVVVIEVGTAYPDAETFTVNGTSGNPIWIMSSSDGTRAELTNPAWSFQANYYIIDQLNWNLGTVESAVAFPGQNTMVRNCAVSSTWETNSGAGFSLSYGVNNVFYNNAVGPLGDWTKTTGEDIDQHGMKMRYQGGPIWIVDNVFNQCMGDGVQIGDDAPTNQPEDITYIYIARNTAYQMCQSGFWTKNATHVVFSQNTVYTINEGCIGGDGQTIGGQYDATDVWFLYNTLHDAAAGIKIGGGSVGDGGPWYAIGNVIYAIQSAESSSVGQCNAYNYGALAYRNAGGFYAYHNTVYGADSFVCTVPTGQTIVVRDNIFASPLTTDLACVQINSQEYPTMDYNLYSQDGIRFGWDGGTAGAQGVQYTSVATFASSETQEQNSPTPADPLFTNAAGHVFTLQASSPAIDASNTTIETVYATYLATYGVSINVDHAGNSREASGTDWEIGAFAYGAASIGTGSAAGGGSGAISGGGSGSMSSTP